MIERPNAPRHLSAPVVGLQPARPGPVTTPSPEDASRAAGGMSRTGLLGWWLNLTAPHWPTHTIPIAERERLRKAELTSLSILAIFTCLLALVSNSLADATTAEAVGAIAISLLIAGGLNRTGRTRAAAYLVPSVMLLIIMANILQGAMELINLPIYDLLAIPIFLVSLIGDRRAPWTFAALSIAFVVGSYMLQERLLVSLPNGLSFDGIAYEESIFGTWGMINRHVTLLFFAAFFGWLGARSVDHAIARADRAEEIAQLEHAYAEQSRQLEEGIRKIQETHVEVANGNYAARAPLAQDHILWQIAYALNNLIQRLQRNAEAAHLLARTEAEVKRLLEEINRAEHGLTPIWPSPSGTPLDPLLIKMRALRSG